MTTEGKPKMDILVPGSAKATYYNITEEMKLNIDELQNDTYKELELHEALAAQRRQLIREINNVYIRSARYTEMTLLDTVARKTNNLNAIKVKLAAMCRNASGPNAKANDSSKPPSSQDTNAAIGNTLATKITALQEKCGKVDELIQQVSAGQIYVEALELLEEEDKRKDAEDDKDSEEEEESECEGQESDKKESEKKESEKKESEKQESEKEVTEKEESKEEEIDIPMDDESEEHKINCSITKDEKRGRITGLKGKYKDIYKIGDPCPPEFLAKVAIIVRERRAKEAREKAEAEAAAAKAEEKAKAEAETAAETNGPDKRL